MAWQRGDPAGLAGAASLDGEARRAHRIDRRLGGRGAAQNRRRRPGRPHHEVDARGALGVKRAALVDLGRHLGMFVTKPYHDGNIEVVTNAREIIIERIERLAASERVRDAAAASAAAVAKE